NITLLFSTTTYQRVADAYLAGLEDRASRGEDISSVASVASFFISRIDSAVDAAIAGTEALRGLAGKAAIANAKLAYRHYRELVGGSRWAALAQRGAQTQRLLWASTSS